MPSPREPVVLELTINGFVRLASSRAIVIQGVLQRLRTVGLCEEGTRVRVKAKCRPDLLHEPCPDRLAATLADWDDCRRREDPRELLALSS